MSYELDTVQSCCSQQMDIVKESENLTNIKRVLSDNSVEKALEQSKNHTSEDFINSDRESRVVDGELEHSSIEKHEPSFVMKSYPYNSQVNSNALYDSSKTETVHCKEENVGSVSFRIGLNEYKLNMKDEGPENGVNIDSKLPSQNKREKAEVSKLKSKMMCSTKMVNKKVALKNVKGKNGAQDNSCDHSYIFHKDIPLIGKNVFTDSDEKPLHKRYDLAKEINKARSIYSQKEAKQIPSIDFNEWMKRKNGRSAEEIKAEDVRKRVQDLRSAMYVTKICRRILKLMADEEVDEKALEKNFDYFLSAPVSQKSLLYVPHFVHAVMFCRGCKNFGRQVRTKADDCFQRCHSMFPIPVGYNFESVYSALVKRCLPQAYDRMDSTFLEYEELSETESELSENE